MSKNAVDVATDIPFSVPNRVDVVVDLPVKRFSVNPRVAALVVVGVVTVGAIVAYKMCKRAQRDAQLEEALVVVHEDQDETEKPSTDEE